MVGLRETIGEPCIIFFFLITLILVFYFSGCDKELRKKSNLSGYLIDGGKFECQPKATNLLCSPPFQPKGYKFGQSFHYFLGLAKRASWVQRCKESGFSFLACNDGVGSLCISPTEYCTGKVDISDPQTVTVSGRNRNGEEVTLECPYSDDPLSRVPADSALVETCRMLEGEVIHCGDQVLCNGGWESEDAKKTYRDSNMQ